MLTLIATLFVATPASTSTSALALFARVHHPDGLTAEDAAQRAQQTSHDVHARQAELRAAAAAVDEALIGYFPRLSAKAAYNRLSSIEQPNLGTFSFPVILNQYSLEATLSVGMSDYLWRLPQLNRAAKQSERAAALNAKAARLRVAQDARLGYYNWVRAQLQAEVAQEALHNAQGHLHDAQSGRQAGSVSEADVLRVRSQVAAAELYAERSRAYAALTEHQLRTALHADQTFTVGEDLSKNVAIPAGRDPRLLHQEAVASRLELQILEQNEAALGARADAVKAGYWPRLDAFASALYANPNQRIIPAREAFDATWAVGVQATYTINDLFTAQAQASNLEAQAARLASEREQVADAIGVEVVQALLALREAEVAQQTTGRGLTAAEESYRVRRLLFQAGQSTSVELTDAETELTRARLEAVNAQVDHRVAAARLRHATGRDIQPD